MKRALLAITICLASVAPALAQSVPPPPPPPPAQTNPNAPALKVTSRVVQVNVIVHDKNGQPVTGLTKSDFTILDQGQPQTLASFSEQTNKVTTTMVSNPATNTFTNRIQEEYGVPPSVSVILIDSLNMLDYNGRLSRANLTMARGQVEKFLSQLHPQDRVALYFLSNKIYILHDFTSDAGALLRAMDIIPRLRLDQPNATPSMNFTPASPALRLGAPLGADRTGPSSGEMNPFDIINRVGQTTAMLEAIANHLAGVPGRKNLIWVSGSFPFCIPARNFSEQIENAAKSLSNANVAIYPVDARGVIVNMPTLGPLCSYGPQTFNTMVVLADRTGGRALYNTNDITGSIRRAIDDSRVSYVLTYYPNHNKWNGDFREIKVKVNRPGVEVRARRGYFATPDVAVSPKSKEEIMVDAAKNPIESATLGMDVQADSVATPDACEIKTQIKFDPAQLQLARTADHWIDSVDVKWVQVDADGRILASSSQTLNLNIPAADYESVLRKGLTFSGDVKLVKDATDVRIVARDSGNGSVGTVNISIDRLFPPTTTK